MTELKVTAEPGVPQILTEREFDAPRELILRPICWRSGWDRAATR